MAKRKLKKIKIKGNRGIHYFEDTNGKKVRIKCTVSEYQQLGLPEALKPVHPLGYRWLYSTIEPEYNTPDGDLPDDSYAILTDTGKEKAAIKIKEKDYVGIFDSSEVVNDEVDLIL